MVPWKIGHLEMGVKRSKPDYRKKRNWFEKFWKVEERENWKGVKVKGGKMEAFDFLVINGKPRWWPNLSGAEKCGSYTRVNRTCLYENRTWQARILYFSSSYNCTLIQMRDYPVLPYFLNQVGAVRVARSRCVCQILIKSIPLIMWTCYLNWLIGVELV